MPSGKGSPGKGGKAGGKGGGKSGKGTATSRSTAARRGAAPSAPAAGRGGGSGRAAAATIKAAPGRPPRPSEPPRLRVQYRNELRTALQKDLALPNPMLVPRLEKIVLNMGVGRAVAQPSLLEGAVRDLTVISGQKPIVTRAKKSIAAFKLRQGNAIGAKVTLRGDRMWEFFDRLLSLAIPRIRDFRGLSPRGFDGRGNYTFGVNEQLIFPEVDYDKIDAPRGMDLTIVTTARTDAEGRALLDAFGFPFRREGAA
jgi:large subunit ribosomal protein L5